MQSHANPQKHGAAAELTPKAQPNAVASPTLAHAAGNQQFQRALGIRFKLAASQPGDPDEQEADKVADAFASGAGNAATIHRKCAGPGCDEPPVQRKAVAPTPAPRATPRQLGLNAAVGAPLAPDARHDFERFFGADLSAVRVHSYPAALTAAQSLNARAFTVGQNIAFAAGQYAPHTTSGRKLLAHELTHVVQQAGGSEQSKVRGVGPRIQAQGQISERDMEAIRLWLEGEKDPWVAQMEALKMQPFVNKFPSVSAMKQADWPTGLPGEAAPDIPKFDPEWRSKMQYGTPPRGAFCITSGHQTPQQLWEAHQRREAEWRELRRKQALAAAWPGMHKAQQREELDRQGGSLENDVRMGQATEAQLRVKIFDRALQRASFDIDPIGAREGPTAEMRDRWKDAQQATLVINALLAAATEEIPADIATPFAETYRSYFKALGVAFAAMDRDAARIQALLDETRAIDQMRKASACPTQQCHQPAHGTGTPSIGGWTPPQSKRPSTATSSAFDRGLGGSTADFGPRLGLGLPQKTVTSLIEDGSGYRSTRLTEALARLNGAPTLSTWRSLVMDFGWSTAEIDRMLRNRLHGDKPSQELIEQFEFQSKLLARQQKMLADHPEALKITAVFYPKQEFVKDEQGKEMAKGIPWQFYLTRNPEGEFTKVPAGYEWQLHDLTAPKRPDRTVRTKHQITMLEAHFRDTGLAADPYPIHLMDPPRKLFEELNHRDFFPEGVLYFRYPLSGKTDRIDMTDDTPFGDWLNLIGMAIAIVGTLVSGGLGGPILLPFLVGTGISLVGRMHRLEEKERHGVLTEGDVTRFYWDLALDVVNGLTLGLGRVVSAARVAGNLARAQSAARAYFYLRRTQIVMDVINVGVITHDFVVQYQAIINSKMTPEQKTAALSQLTMFAFLAGGLSIVSLRSGAIDWNKRPTLRLDIDPANSTRTIGDFEMPGGISSAVDAGVDAGEHLATRASSDARIVKQTSFVHPNGERHSFALWSDGRITRCSPPPCLQIAQSIVGRSDELMGRLYEDSVFFPEIAALGQRARKLRADAASAARSKKTLQAQGEELVGRARQLEADLADLEQRAAREMTQSDLRGMDRAERMYGRPALMYMNEPWGKYYVWRFDKRTATLRFQRRNQAVPDRRFDPDTGRFEVERPLFVPVDNARLEQLRKSSVTRDFNVTAVIDNIDDLRRLRPASQYEKKPPKDWVVVRISDDNLVHFYTEPVPHGTIFEFPDGSRVWRTASNTIATEGAVRAPIGRRGFEQSKPAQLDPTGANEGVPVVQTTGVEHQRAHPRGQGTGFELFNHIPLAPTYVNQQLQARGIEMYIDQLRQLYSGAHPGRPALDFRLLTEHTVFPGTSRQAWIDYHLLVVRPGKQPSRLFTLRIGTDYSKPRAPANYEWRNPPRNPEDLALLDAPEMDAARAELERRIREARAAQ